MKIIMINNTPLSINIKNLIRSLPQDINVLQAQSHESALNLINADKSILMTIIFMDDKSDFWKEYIKLCLNKNANMQFIVFSSSKDSRDMQFSYFHNVVGFIPKNFTNYQIKNTLSFIFGGGIFFPPIFNTSYSDKVPTSFTSEEKNNEINDQEYKLTNRQEEVLNMLSKGLSNKQIAYKMNLAEATVKLHINALLRALNVRNRTHAVITAQKLGII